MLRIRLEASTDTSHADAAPHEVVQAAAKLEEIPVAIRPFRDYQVASDASRYLTVQTERLVNSPDYPVDRYIDKRWSTIPPDGVQLETGVLDSAIGALRRDGPANNNPAVVLASLSDGTAVLLPDGSYKLDGGGAGLWWVAGLCRFEPGELDPYVPSIRHVHAGEPLSKWLHPVSGHG